MNSMERNLVTAGEANITVAEHVGLNPKARTMLRILCSAASSSETETTEDSPWLSFTSERLRCGSPAQRSCGFAAASRNLNNYMHDWCRPKQERSGSWPR